LSLATFTYRAATSLRAFPPRWLNATSLWLKLSPELWGLLKVPQKAFHVGNAASASYIYCGDLGEPPTPEFDSSRISLRCSQRGLQADDSLGACRFDRVECQLRLLGQLKVLCLARVPTNT
jgi:hypothetical protein